jgi:hypothetical protein
MAPIGWSAGAAVFASTSNDDVVAGDVVAPATGDALERGLERRIRELLDLSALAADEMVVMVAARVGGLVARDAVTEVNPLDEPEGVKALEGAIDARDTHPSAARTHAVVDLLGREAAVLAAEELDDLAPCSATAAARLSQEYERALGPHLAHRAIMIPVLMDMLPWLPDVDSRRSPCRARARH